MKTWICRNVCVKAACKASIERDKTQTRDTVNRKSVFCQGMQSWRQATSELDSCAFCLPFVYLHANHRRRCRGLD